MKKHYILNRPMFNRGGVSAYGKGIASNLVTEEQRQRFNYGGRVGFQPDNPIRYVDWSDAWTDYIKPGWDKFSETMRIGSGIPAYLKEGDVLGQTGYPTSGAGNLEKKYHKFLGYDVDNTTEREDILYEDPLADAKRLHAQKKAREKNLEPGDKFATAKRLLTSDDAFNQQPIVKKAEVIEANDRGDVMTDSDWMDLLGPTEEQKRRTKGEAQLNLAAGALDVFSQPTIAKGMKAASPHLSKLAQTVGADQKARDKAILQGKVLSKVYTDRAGAKGKADIELAKYKVDAIKAAETPRARYFAGLDAKQGMKKSMAEALGYPIQTVKKDKQGLPIIPEGTSEETIMWDTESGFMMLKGGNLVPVTETQIFGIAT